MMYFYISFEPRQFPLSVFTCVIFKVRFFIYVWRFFYLSLDVHIVSLIMPGRMSGVFP